MGLPAGPGALGAGGPGGGAARGSCLGLLEVTVGLKVTVRCGFGATGRGPAEPWAREEMSGVVSVELDAMMGTFTWGTLAWGTQGGSVRGQRAFMETA
jgi:hypothetical protein